MSGDVQPKRRKDKKRRKDDGEQVPIQTHVPLLTTNVINDDVNIHVHKESGTGGDICAKFVFFVLFSALAVLIGLIITEHRGLTDLDSADTESKYSQIFEGWVDTNAAHYDNHDVEQHIESQDEHELEHEDEYNHEEDENVNDSEDEEHEQEIEPSNESEESANEEDDEESKFSNEASNEEEQEDENDNDEDDYDNSVDESEERIVDEDEENDRVQASEEENDGIQASEEENDQDDGSYENDSEEKEIDDQEQDVHSDEENNDKEEQDEDELKYVDENYEAEEPHESEDIDQNMQSEEKYIESNEERVELIQKEKRSPKKDSQEVEDEQVSDGYIQDKADVAVKLGVGVALLVVAYLVLVKKWRTAAEDKRSTESFEEPTPDLSRRNTIVVPPSFQEVEPDIEQDNEDYSEEEEDMSDSDRDTESKSAKTKYQELSLKYSRSFTPDDDHDNQNDYEANIAKEEEESEDEEEEEDEEDSKNEDYDEDEDEELLKRLEAKYGKLQDEKSYSKKPSTWKHINLPPNTNEETDSDRESDDSTGYETINITNKDDFHIKKELDESQKHIENNSSYAIKLFDQILQKYPSSPRSLYGKALALDNLADQRRSNTLLNKALKLYTELLNSTKVPDALFEIAANRCIHRMRFIGQYNNLINIHNLVIDKFPDNPKHLNDLAVTLLTINRVEDARKVLEKVLSKWPQNGFALVHYGFILKTTDNKLEEAVYYLKSGINTNEVGVHDGRFFFHLGDALSRLGRTDEAIEVYKKGAKNKVFLSTFQRSLYNIPRLTGKPWWDIEDLPFHTLFKTLKQYWKTIRDEGLSVLNQEGYFKDEAENLKDTGTWKQFELYARGQKNRRNCNKCPFTCSVIDKFPEARGCKRGQTKFSVMHPKTHVWPHSGPTNCRLRAHLGLKVPANTYIRVVNETRSWKEGDIMVFDDSFEHEVWHNGTDFRLVLIVDVWHPELTPSEKSSISPI